MYILKISAIKSMIISTTTIVKITDRNAGMQKVLNCQITNIRKMSAKLFKIFPNSCEIFLKRLVWTLDVEKFRTKMVIIAKAHIILVKKKTSDVLSSDIVRHDWKVINVFKLKRKNVLFHEINMKNSLKRVNLDSSITIAKSKLVKIFIVTEFVIHRKHENGKEKYKKQLLT